MPATRPSRSAFGLDSDLARLQTGGSCLEDYRSGRARRANDCQAQTVEGAVLPGLERLEAGGVTVVGCDDLTRAGDFKGDVVLHPRHLEALLVCDSRRDVAEVLAIGLERRGIGRERDFGCGAGGLDDLSRPPGVVLVSNHFQNTRLINHVVPAQAIFKRTPRLPAE